MPLTIAGSGTITGLAVGGLPDGTVDADTLAAGTAAKWTTVAGSASGRSVEWTGLPAGIKHMNVSYWQADVSSGSHLLIQLGYGSTTWDDTDIDSISWWGYTANQEWNHYTKFRLNNGHDNSARDNYGVITCTHSNSNKWHVRSTQHQKAEADSIQGMYGIQELGGELTAVRIYCENDVTFDSGTFSLNYLV